MPYCIYTDQEVSAAQMTPEHVIPLALGGANGFRIWVDGKRNSELGSELDGAYSNDFLVQLRRRAFDARGHSGKPVIPTLPNSRLQDTGQKVRVAFGDTLDVVDVRQNQVIPPEDRGEGSFESQLKIDVSLPLRIASKIALGGAYFVCGEVFRKQPVTDDLRLLMSYPLHQIPKARMEGLGIKIVDRFLAAKDFGRPEARMMSAFADLVAGSFLALQLCEGALVASVGLLGELTTILILPIRSGEFPNANDLDLGHVVSVSSAGLMRESFRSAMMRLLARFPAG